VWVWRRGDLTRGGGVEVKSENAYGA